MNMNGGIYSDRKCPECGSNFKDTGRGLFCPNHRNIQATRFIVKFPGVWKRFTSYEQAQRFLTGLRFKTDEGSFDPRDYRRDNPLGFQTLMEKWRDKKKEEVRPGSYKNLRNYAEKSIAFFGQRNIKEIGFADIEDFLDAQKVSNKTKANMNSALHDFWIWLKRRQVITHQQLPEFPEIAFELGYRPTVPKDVQSAILDEVRRLTAGLNPKVWIGIKFLCTYISVRPCEMAGLLEGDIDLGNGYLRFPHPKEKRFKMVPLIDEDIELLRSFPAALPHVPFFRHVAGIKGCKEGSAFGQRYFWKWWVKACDNLNIKGVDLYGGTRHSSALALRQVGCSPEEIRRATMHTTNKAFERYYRVESDEIRAVYEKTQAATRVQPGKSASKRGKLLNFKK